MSLDATVTGVAHRVGGVVVLELANTDGGPGLMRIDNPDTEVHRLLGKRIWGCTKLVRCGDDVIADRYVQGIRLRPRWWAAIT